MYYINRSVFRIFSYMMRIAPHSIWGNVLDKFKKIQNKEVKVWWKWQQNDRLFFSSFSSFPIKSIFLVYSNCTYVCFFSRQNDRFFSIFSSFSRLPIKSIFLVYSNYTYYYFFPPRFDGMQHLHHIIYLSTYACQCYSTC